MEECKNSVKISARVKEKPELVLDTKEVKLYRFLVEILRTSGAEDEIVVIAKDSEEVRNLEVGSAVNIHGEYRSKNEDGHLKLYVFAKGLYEVPFSEEINEIELIGYTCKPAIYRETPFGKRIVDLLVAVNGPTKSNYIPVIVWNKNADMLRDAKPGMHIYIKGRMQSRTYEKVTEDTNEVRVAYEISGNYVEVLKE